MIKLWWGSDELAARDAWRAAVAAARAEAPAGLFIQAHGDELRPAELAEWLVARELLTGLPPLIAADHWLGEASSRNLVLPRLASLADSDTLFLLLEGGDETQLVEVFKLAAAVTPEPRAARAGTRKMPTNLTWSPFPLTDALLARDRRRLWLRMVEALVWREVAAEDVFWRLWWQIKTLRLVAADEATARRNLKPFVWQKTKSALARFTAAELEALIDRLMDCWRGDRRGGLPLSLALERFALEI